MEELRAFQDCFYRPQITDVNCGRKWNFCLSRNKRFHSTGVKLQSVAARCSTGQTSVSDEISIETGRRSFRMEAEKHCAQGLRRLQVLGT